MRLRGQVVKKAFGTGSKSEHQAVMLMTDGRELVLRRQGGNPFADAVLNRLVGKTIECEGLIHGQTLIISQWRKV